MKRSPWTEPQPDDSTKTRKRARCLSPDPWLAPRLPRADDDEIVRDLVTYQSNHCRAVVTPLHPVERAPTPKIAGYVYSIDLGDAHDLDPEVYRLTLAVDRQDGALLTEDEVEELRVALITYRAAVRTSRQRTALPKKRVNLF